MEKLIVLGTGNALATECYNTCFLIKQKNEYIMVDAGGGNGILSQMKKVNVEFSKVRHLIITHAHSDHVLGVVWVIRKIATLMKKNLYNGDFHIWCHEELSGDIRQLSQLTLQQKFVDLFDEQIMIHQVKNDEKAILMNDMVTFFDIYSTKKKQYGFSIQDEEKKFTYLGDEPFNSKCKKYIEGVKWLMCEAFCLYSERDIFEPYEKHHATVKEACELAEEFKIPNLILSHTEDKNYAFRKELYVTEGRDYYSGDLSVPYDLETIDL